MIEISKFNENIKNVFLNEKYKIDFRLMSKKEIILFKWNQLVKGLTHLFYLTIISTLFGLGWKYVLELTELNVWETIQQKTVLIGYGIGHFITQLSQVFLDIVEKLELIKK